MHLEFESALYFMWNIITIKQSVRLANRSENKMIKEILKGIFRPMMRRIFRPMMRRAGYDIVGHTPDCYPPHFREIYNIVRPFTITCETRVNALINAVEYVVENEIDGAMVECGVWKGGSAMAMALTLKKLGSENRDLYLYDTFSGMSVPTDVDISCFGEKAHDLLSKKKSSEVGSIWCLSPLKEVKENVFSTGYEKEKFHFIEGKVEDTLPKTTPKEIAILRLDTDWYESTKHELIHLFPLLKRNGVLIIDDYGSWEGSRKAVDEYIADNNIRILLNRMDSSSRIAVKT